MQKSQIQLSQYDRCQTQLSKEFKQCRPFQIYQSTVGFSRFLAYTENFARAPQGAGTANLTSFLGSCKITTHTDHYNVLMSRKPTLSLLPSHRACYIYSNLLLQILMNAARKKGSCGNVEAWQSVTTHWDHFSAFARKVLASMVLK